MEVNMLLKNDRRPAFAYAASQGNSAKRIFVNALCFLYLLGKISYQSGTDSIKLIES